MCVHVCMRMCAGWSCLYLPRHLAFCLHCSLAVFTLPPSPANAHAYTHAHAHACPLVHHATRADAHADAKLGMEAIKAAGFMAAVDVTQLEGYPHLTE